MCSVTLLCCFDIADRDDFQGSTSIPVTLKDGTKQWMSPIVDATKGPLKSSAAWRDPALAKRGEKRDP